MILTILHWLMVSLFVGAPLAAGAYAAAQWGRGRVAPASRMVAAFTIGSMVGIILTVLYAEALRSRASAGQYLLAMYFATSMLLVLKGIDWVLHLGLRKLAGGVGLTNRKIAPVILMAARGLLMIFIGLPLVLAALMVYRPKITPRGNPVAGVNFRTQPVEFRSTDGVRLSGWWAPASEPTGRMRRRWLRPADFGTKTVIICQGVASSQTSQLVLARSLIPAGYNVLTFDFRASGSSGGQISTMGDLERRDVLGAVRFLRQNYASQSKRIVGIGVSTGAAALIAAAADHSTEGQAIEAVAVYGTYDDLGSLAREMAQQALLPPMDWLACRLSLPLASAMSGTNLSRFSPAQDSQSLWPRPLLVIHGTSDPVIPFERGRTLFDAATFPKQQLWLPSADQIDAINDDGAAETVLDFFEDARPRQAI
jgi:alpha-beta hydrolase superfamily lysophospholipase